MNESRSIIEDLTNTRHAVEPETEMVVDEGPAESYGDVVMEERATAPYGREEALYNKRDLTIKHLHHGYIVEVDCHRFAFETVDRMLKYVGEYLKDPIATEKKWWNKELF
jgi:hypothetical protein